MLDVTGGAQPALRRMLGLVTVALVLLMTILLDAPESSLLRWIAAVMTVLAVGGLVGLSDESRWRVGPTVVVMLFAALLAAAALLTIADSYIHAIPDLLAALIFVGTLAAVATAGMLLAARTWRFRAVAVLGFVLTVVAGALTYFGLTPWACNASMPPDCWSGFGVALPYSTPLPAALAGVGVGTAVRLVTLHAARRTHDSSGPRSSGESPR